MPPLSCTRREQCVRDMVCSSEFLLTQALLSPISSPGQCRSIPARSGSFDWFCDTMACSDLPTPFIAAFDLTIFSARCRPPSCSAGGWDLPVPIPEASTHPEGLRPRRSPAALAISSCGLLPSASLTASAARDCVFRGSIPRLRLPQSTLRRTPYGLRRMTRGQNDWLGLFCATLSFATSCSFSGASERRTIHTYSSARPLCWTVEMSGNQGVPGSKRRSSEEIKRPVLEFEASRLSN